MLSLLESSTAQLVFEKRSHFEQAEPGQGKFEVSFSFRNQGTEVVRILDLDSSCGCLSSQTDRMVYGPGESGSLSAVFKLGSMVGTMKKALYVKTNLSDAQEGKSHILEVSVEIPEIISITPKVLHWQVGEELKQKHYDIEIQGEYPIAIKSMNSTRKQMNYELLTLEAGRRYRILMTPSTTEIPIMGALRIGTDSKLRKYRKKMAFFSITKKKAKAL